MLETGEILPVSTALELGVPLTLQLQSGHRGGGVPRDDLPLAGAGRHAGAVRMQAQTGHRRLVVKLSLIKRTKLVSTPEQTANNRRGDTHIKCEFIFCPFGSWFLALLTSPPPPPKFAFPHFCTRVRFFPLFSPC